MRSDIVPGGRFPDYELADDPTRIVSIWARAFSRIPLRLG